jgi:hypothetical protein
MNGADVISLDEYRRRRDIERLIPSDPELWRSGETPWYDPSTHRSGTAIFTNDWSNE